MEIVRIETARLILRAWTMEDAEDMYDYACTDIVGPAAGWKPHESIEETRETIKALFLPPKAEAWAMQRKDDGRVIGSIGLHKDASRAQGLPVRMLGYVLNPKDWGNGFMQEGCIALMDHAFHNLGIELITVAHFPDNHRSRRVIERLGFRLEGTRRMADTLHDGTITDEIAYSMTCAEFEALHPTKA